MISPNEIDKLKGHVPDKVITELSSLYFLSDLDNILVLSHFLGQCSHESNNFSVVEENLSYSKERINQVFPKYFRDVAPGPYARNPKRLASMVYANRMGNGPKESFDGYTYRGRGYIQLTGKDNYTEFFKFMAKLKIIDSEDSNPDLVARSFPLWSALWFWNKNKLSNIAKHGIDHQTITDVSRRVNGSNLGLDKRIKITTKFHRILNLNS